MPRKALEGRTKGEKTQAFQPWEHLYKSTSAKNCQVVMWPMRENAGPGHRGLECTCISGSDLLDYIEQGWSLPPLMMLYTDLHWNCRF